MGHGRGGVWDGGGMSDSHEHKFLADLQPFTGKPGNPPGLLFWTAVNWAALFGVAYVIGLGFKLGSGQ